VHQLVIKLLNIIDARCNHEANSIHVRVHMKTNNQWAIRKTTLVSQRTL